jgi:hypothetical protein
VNEDGDAFPGSRGARPTGGIDMRRISLALALIGAVAAAGCGQTSTSNSGGNRGTAGSFTVIVQNGQAVNGSLPNSSLAIKNGYVTSDVGGIDCGAGTGHATCSATFTEGTTVNLTAHADTSVDAGMKLLGWAGDCAGDQGCVLSGSADKYVVVTFGTEADRTWHPNFSEGHGPKYNDFANGVAGALQCTSCHGADLMGAGIAPSCNNCHPAPTGEAIELGAHFDAAAAAWGNHTTGWTQACQRCHIADGFRDYMGVDGSANNLSGSFNVSNVLAVPAINGTVPGAYAWGPLTCNVCHNSKTDPMGWQNSPGVSQLVFPSMQVVNLVNGAETFKVQGLCAQCHQARESTQSVNTKINAKVAAASQGLGTVSLATTSTGTAGTASPLVGGTFVADLAKGTPLPADIYKGYTAIFAGTVDSKLNGFKAIVAGNTLGTNTASAAGTTTVTFDRALPAAPVKGESLVLYPTASGGTLTTLVDASRSWTTDQWKDSYVFFSGFQTAPVNGSTYGAYAQITGNDATTLTFAAITAALVAPQGYYIILPKQVATVLDAPLGSATSAFSWVNPHYLGAAATIWGAQAAMYYQYPVTYDATPATKTYRGGGSHRDAECTDCHNAHSLEVSDTMDCSATSCHHTHSGTTAQNLPALRLKTGRNYDGGNDDGVYQNFLNMKATFYQAIQKYSAKLGNVNAGTSTICFDDARYSYWFVATAADITNGTCTGTVGWGTIADATKTPPVADSNTRWTPRLVRATYNYKFLAQDAGAWIHNPRYAAQIMYDAVKDLNAGLAPADQIDVSAWTRP